ncbi:acyl-CoA dehydrogenase family protein [Nonomuraea sp. JJY05]|uniref:acyl-CoA dehydrogenase family protein n=1 Tax=Nonomuraea sp. JJY05 TaxID=3350255 RepID=UPI00373F2D68
MSASDPASVRTRARRVDEGWETTGTKMWTTGARYAHAIVVLARTDGSPADRHAGLSQFIVDLPAPGVEIRPIHTIDGEYHFTEAGCWCAATSRRWSPATWPRNCAPGMWW